MSGHILIYKDILYFIISYKRKQLPHDFSKIFRNSVFKIKIKNENVPAF